MATIRFIGWLVKIRYRNVHGPHHHNTDYSTGQSIAAPRTPPEAPWWLRTMGVWSDSLKTYRATASGKAGYSSSIADIPPPNTTMSGSAT
mgnify:CR=1 FL=1